MPTEYSIRLTVRPGRRAAVLAHPLLAGSGRPATPREGERIYFDTADQELARRGMALHLAGPPGHGRQTLETVLDRLGWMNVEAHSSSRVTSGVPEPASLAQRTATAPVPADATLTKAFSARFATAAHRVELGPARLEIALQRGELRAGTRRQSFEDLVLRLRGGSPAALADVAADLQRELRLHVQPRSLAERGHALRRPLPLAIEYARGFTLTPDMPADAAFSAVIGQCIGLYRQNEDGLRLGEDPESVHQTRVALRQIGSACSVFAGAVPARTTASLRAEVRWLARILGEVRDWEVLRTETFAEAPHGTLDGPQLDAFDQALLVRIAAARVRMRRALASLRYAALQTLLTRWAVSQPWREGLEPAEELPLSAPVRECAEAELRRRRRRLLKKGDALGRASPEERHQARIAAKKLRYAIDFFESLYPSRATAAYSRALRKVQDALGALNDNHVARERLRQMAAIPMTAGHPPIRSVSLERYLAAQEEPMMEKLAKAWRRLIETPTPVAFSEES